MNIVLAVIAGLGASWIPYTCFRLLGRDQLVRSRGILYGCTGGGVLLGGFALAIETHFLIAGAVFLGSMFVILFQPHARQKADFVVDQPLLADAVSPQLTAELEKLEAAAREQRLDQINPVNRNSPSSNPLSQAADDQLLP